MERGGKSVGKPATLAVTCGAYMLTGRSSSGTTAMRPWSAPRAWVSCGGEADADSAGTTDMTMAAMSAIASKARPRKWFGRRISSPC